MQAKTATATTFSDLFPFPTASTGSTPPFLEELWNADYLETLRFKGDPLADAPMQALFAEGGVPELLKFLHKLISDTAVPDYADYSEDVRGKLDRYMEQSSKLPEWMDEKKVKLAQQVFQNNPFVAFTLLGSLSLPVLYTCGRGGIQVLMLTEQLNTKVERRLVETGFLTTGAMRKGGLWVEGDSPTDRRGLPIGLSAIQRVRLLHAATRTIISGFYETGKRARANGEEVRIYQGKPADEMWRDEWGVPIHQQYLAGTLMTFSYLVLWGLKRLGVFLSKEESEAYMHTWNVVGYLLGIDERVLLQISSYDAGRALYRNIMTINRSNEPDQIEMGRILTKSLLEYQTEQFKRQLPGGAGRRLTHIPKMLMHRLLSKGDRELLGVEITAMDRIFIPCVNFLFWLRAFMNKALGTQYSSFAHWYFEKTIKDIEENYTQLKRDTSFRYQSVPVERRREWGIEE
jgi:hypothetical protein